MKKAISKSSLLPVVMMALAVLFAATAHAAAPGITGPTFNLTAQTAFLNQPDGAAVYSWGYGCNGAPAGFAPQAPTAMPPRGPTTAPIYPTASPATPATQTGYRPPRFAPYP